MDVLSRPCRLVVFSQDKNRLSGHSNKEGIMEKRSGSKSGRAGAKRRMAGKAWERFELTGAVEDYLRYRGLDWREEKGLCASDRASGAGRALARADGEERFPEAGTRADGEERFPEAGTRADGEERFPEAGARTDRRMTGYGTDDHGDGYGAGGLSLR